MNDKEPIRSKDITYISKSRYLDYARPTGYSSPDAGETRKLVRERFKSAKNIVVQMGSAVGDTVIQTGYFNGVLASLDGLGRGNVPVTLVVPKNMHDLYSAYESKRIKVVPTDVTEEYVKYQLPFVDKFSTDSTFFVDLVGRHEESLPGVVGENLYRGYMFERETKGRRMTVLSTLYYMGQMQNVRGVRYKYGDFVKSVLGLDSSIFPSEIVTTHIPRPKDYVQVKRNWERKLHTDKNTKQIAVVVESQFLGKRYGPNNWAKAVNELVKSIGQQSPGEKVAVNVIYNGQVPLIGFDKRALSEAFADVYKDANVKGNVNFVSGSLKDLAVLLNTQSVVLSNDTGLAHIAAAMPDGPQVVTLYKQTSFSAKFWKSSLRQREILSDDRGPVDQNDPTEINRINPKEVARVAYDVYKVRQQEIASRKDVDGSKFLRGFFGFLGK